MRAEYQVLVIPFIIEEENSLKFVIFKRAGSGIWQFIAGGGEDNEKPRDAAVRESKEEAGIDSEDFFRLKTISMIPIGGFKEHKDKKNLYVIPEYCFGVQILNKEIQLSHEHSEYKLVSYAEAIEYLEFDSNKTALWELCERIKDNDLEDA